MVAVGRGAEHVGEKIQINRVELVETANDCTRAVERGVQEVILAIFKHVARICEQYGLRYFAIGGTAIGAVRHRGFIPWDDDLDIAMPIEDFNRFLQIAPHELPSYLRLCDVDEAPHNHQLFAKVCDERTTAIEPMESAFPDMYKGIWVDIMPMGGVPDKGIFRSAYLALHFSRFVINYSLRHPYQACLTKTARQGWIATAILRPFIDPARVRRKLFRQMSAYSFDGSRYVGYTWSRRLHRLIFPREWFAEQVLMPFEDTQIRMPAGYNEYLTQQFGNYLEPPPVPNQVAHRCYFDLDRSYADYRDGLAEIPQEYKESYYDKKSD